MSRSPVDAKTSQLDVERDSGYRRYLAQLDQLIEDGESWSGNERNCAFLNLGPISSEDVRFATVSAVTGLRFLDDGRAHALVDWDYDGDLDIWTTNRTSPRLRFLRNDASGNHHFLAIRLSGRQCNRDAIGARVEVILPAAAGKKRLVRTLRAGEGFLAQSSKWLHFGLGDNSAVEAIVVDWPGGERQTVRGLLVDSFYKILQGESVAQRQDFASKYDVQLRPEPWRAPTPTNSAQILLSSRTPLPPLPLRQFNGTPDRLDVAGQATWLSLWASWCVPCLEELQEATDRAAELRRAGINVVALSLDGFDRPGVESTTVDGARQTIERLKFPFTSAAATSETVRRLKFMEQLMFGRQSETALPNSYLVMADGRLAAIYRGRVTVDKLLEDAAHLGDDDDTLLKAALPFPGIWFDGRRRFAPLAIVADLLDHGAPNDALDYVRRNQQDLARQPGYVKVIGLLGTTLAQQKKVQPALQMYRWALEIDPNDVPVLNNLAWHLATHDDPSLQDPQEAIRHAESAARLTEYRSAAILDTLATSYAAAQQVRRARITFEQAIEQARRQGQIDLAQRLEAKRAELGY